MKRKKQSTANEYVAQGLETTASVLSVSRVAGGIAIAQHVKENANYQSWKLAFGFGALAATDYLDGKLARFARKLARKDESVRRPFNAYVDQLSDKVMITVIMSAIAQREKANGRSRYARVVQASTAVDTIRNVAVTLDRIQADRQNIDSRAQSGGKLKALEQVLVVGAALSPLSKSAIGRALVGVAASHAAIASVESGLALHESFATARQALHESEAAKAAAYELPWQPSVHQTAEFQVLPQSELPQTWN